MRILDGLMGELLRFPMERRSQRRPSESLPEHEAKVLELKQRPRWRHFAGIPIVPMEGVPGLIFTRLAGTVPYSVVTANGEFSYDAGTDTGDHPSTG